MIISSDEIPFAPREGEGSWTTLQEQIKSTYNLEKFDDEDYYDIANKFELPIHIAFLIIKSLQKDEFLDINDLASASYYSICRDVLIPYKNKAYVFRRYFGLKYPYLKNTDTRLEWFLRQKNGLSLSQKVSLLEQESSYASIGIGKVRFEQALQRINLLVSHEEVEKRRLIEFNGEWALAVTSFIKKERGDLTAAEFLKVGDALQTETKHKLKQNIIGYLLSRMGKIEIYFLATQIRKFHDLISRTSSLIRAFSNVFEHDVKMIERLTSMHSMVDLAHLVENNKSLVDYERLLPFRSFRPMLAAKWAKQYQFPAAVEAKFDGIRLLVHKLGNRVQAYSRRRKNYTNKFPSITNLKDLIPAFSIILDGEIMGVQWTVTGPRYANVYELHDALREGYNTWVLRYVVFDVLYFNGVELVNLPYSKRREIRSMICKSIAQNVQAKGNETGIEIQEVETVIVENKERLIQVYNRFLDSKYEGAIIKNPNGVYELGKRSPNWFKLKPKESLDVVITGVIPIQTGANLRVQGFRYAIKRDEDFLHMGMIRNLDAQKGGRIAELLILNGLIPQQPRLIDLSSDIEHLGRFSGSHERLGFEIEPQIVVSIDYLGIVKRDERFSLRNARFLYLREDKPVDEISTYYDLYDNYMRAFRQ